MKRLAIIDPAAADAALLTGNGDTRYRALFAELAQLGHVEGSNLAVERYLGRGQIDHLEDVVREAVRSAPDVILAMTTPLVRRLREVTRTIQIVGAVADPIRGGLVDNIARPGGNLTGVSVDAGLDLWGKRLEILCEAVPSARRIGFLAITGGAPESEALVEAARRLGISIVTRTLRDPIVDAEYRRIFAEADGDDALVIGSASYNFHNRAVIVGLAAARHLPVMYPNRESVEIGGLIALAIDFADIFRHLASQIDLILRGTDAGDIPIYQASKFDLVINLAAARALGLVLPPSLLARADEVIE
jgi:putative ABC transport system substrate-binding protein